MPRINTNPGLDAPCLPRKVHAFKGAKTDDIVEGAVPADPAHIAEERAGPQPGRGARQGHDREGRRTTRSSHWPMTYLRIYLVCTLKKGNPIANTNDGKKIKLARTVRMYSDELE